MYQLQNFIFPKDFAFGVTDADAQVMGEKFTVENEKAEPTIWKKFSQTPGKVFQGQTNDIAIDRFHRWKEDVEWMKKLGIKHYRTSVAMSRIMTREKKPNKKALQWYETYFKALKKAGILVYVTLYHWDLPQYLSDKGGWKNRQIVDYFVEHSKIIHSYLGEYIYEYYILNEPFQATFESYHNGVQAPGETNLKGALAAVHHMMLAQGIVFHALKKMDKKVALSTVYNPTITFSASSSPKDVLATQLLYEYQTGMFMEPLYRGKYPEKLMGMINDKMPEIRDGDMQIMKVGNGLKTFGINFYRGKIVRYNKNAELKFEEIRYPFGLGNGMGWPVMIPPTYPETLFLLLTKLYDQYKSYGMRELVISENGTCWPDKVEEDGSIHDEFRIFYIREHLKMVAKAILAGVPMKGYFVWTLMDNFEWDLAYNPNSSFGLIYIDRKNKLKRIPKDSFEWYNKVVSTGKIL